MKLADPDWKCSVWTGLVLLGAATSIIFGLRPGGFEGQIGWYLGLLPGVLVDIFLPTSLSQVFAAHCELRFLGIGARVHSGVVRGSFFCSD